MPHKFGLVISSPRSEFSVYASPALIGLFRIFLSYAETPFESEEAISSIFILLCSEKMRVQRCKTIGAT
jgi:hypothetical protein